MGSQDIIWVKRRAEREERADFRADAYMTLAYLFSEQHDIKEVQSSFEKANELYRIAIETPLVLQENEPIPRTKLGILLSSPLYRRHDLKMAFDLFGEAMQDCNCHHAAYWRGRALLYGFGTSRDTMLGFELIQRAAGNDVLRAKFETATLFERGCDGENGSCVRQNPVMAEEYYRSISISAPRNYGDQEWVRDYALSHLFRNEEQLDKDDAMGLQVGNVLSWELAGQAFLFGAAATFHESRYYWVLPTIGIAIGFLSLLSSCSAFLKNSFRRAELRSLFMAKVNACERLVPRPRRQLSHFSSVQARYLQAYLARLAELYMVFLSLGFIIIWGVLSGDYKVPPDEGNFDRLCRIVLEWCENGTAADGGTG